MKQIRKLRVGLKRSKCVEDALITCKNGSKGDEESVGEAEEKRSEVDVSEGVEGGDLRDHYHSHCHHCYEMVQFQLSSWINARIHQLFCSSHQHMITKTCH